MSNGKLKRPGSPSPAIDVGRDGPCITTHAMHTAGNHNVTITPMGGRDGVAWTTGGVEGILVHKSCDLCRERKRKCDGLRPCSRCARLGEQEVCNYSPRKLHRALKTRGRGVAGEFSVDEAGVDPHSETQNGRWRTQAFKRCRLAASPATGLVGLEENAFLGDYFRCLDFWTLTSQSRIREAMVKIITSPSWGRRFRPAEGNARQYTDVQNVVVADVPRAPQGDPTMCIFWCACALGAIVRGRPAKSVSSYAQMAAEAMSLFSGPDTVESAEACTILAYLHGFRGNTVLFGEYLERAGQFLQRYVPVGSTSNIVAGLAEAVKSGETTQALWGCMDEDGLKSFRDEESAISQVSRYATVGEINRFAVQFFRTFVKIYQAQMHASSCDTPSGERGEAPSGNVESGALPEEASEQHEKRAGTSARYGIITGFKDAVLRRFQHFQFGFGRLEMAVDRPGIRGGIGAIVINGALIFEKAAQEDYDGLFERLERFTEVYERYPGLCQFLAMAHLTHIMSAVTVATKDIRFRPLYDKLRNAYNPMRPPDFRAIPSFEEWRGMSQVCDHLYCRSVEEEIILSDELALRPPVARARHVDAPEHQKQTAHGEDAWGENEAGIIPKEYQGDSRVSSTIDARSMTPLVVETTAVVTPDNLVTAKTYNSCEVFAKNWAVTPPESRLSFTGETGLEYLGIPNSLVLPQEATGNGNSEVMSGEFPFDLQDNDQITAEYTRGQLASVIDIDIGGAAVRTVAEEAEETTVKMSGQDTMLASESEPYIDDLSTSDWLDVTYAMLMGHN